MSSIVTRHDIVQASLLKDKLHADEIAARAGTRLK